MDSLDMPEPDVQPETFRQGVDEPAPEPEPEQQQETAPEPQAEPEPEPVAPSWLDEAPPEPQYQPEPGYPPQPGPQYPPNVPQGVPTQNVPQPGTQRGLEAFVDNPDGYISALVEQRLNSALSPLAQQQQMMMGVTQQMYESQLNSVKGQADSGIKRAYERFNQDSTFRSNKQLQSRIENTFRGLRRQAEMAARNGDFGPMMNLASINDGHIAATLAAAKAIEGIQAGGQAPLQVMGASVESTQPASNNSAVELTAEEQEIARRIGGNYADRMRKAKAEATKYNDFEG